jgi:lipid-A-disaccharide synthase
LLQEAFNPAAIVAALEPLLDPAAAERSRMLVGYGRLRQALGDPGVTQRAASAILDQVQQAHPCA